jgi:LysR family transcriptional regulator, glycine cleavage system transcriptional activator
MGRSLPPLLALRAFEAAARHGSFARAAEELSVTPAAVSQQVRYLEERLDVRLFTRHPRGIQLTRVGAEYAETLGIALDQIAAATDRVRISDRAGKLTIATTPSFAAKWLMPRLIRFQNRHPELDVRLSTSNALADFTHQDIDVAVRYGKGRWSGLHAELLLTTERFPVCSPSLRDGPVTLQTPDDLRNHTMLHLMVDEWAEWLSVAGLGELVWRRGPQYSDAGLLTQAAVEGHGVALGQRVLVADDLAAGRLVEPFTLRIPSEFAYYVVVLPGALERPKVTAFYQWLREEVSRAQVDGSA